MPGRAADRRRRDSREVGAPERRIGPGDIDPGRPPIIDDPQQPPIDRPPRNRPPIDVPPLGRPPIDRPPIDRPPIDRPPIDRPPIDRPPIDRPPIDPNVDIGILIDPDTLRRSIPSDEVVLDRRPIDLIGKPKLLDSVGTVIDRLIPDRPNEPIDPGLPGTPVLIPAEQFGVLVRQSAVGEGRRVVWDGLGGEAIALLDTIRTGLNEGLIAVGLTLQTVETGKAELTVPLAVGSAGRDTGLLMLAPELPDGDLTLARLWGEAVTATAWRAVLEVVTSVAAMTGTDAFGQPLRPAAVRASKEGVTVLPQAAHILRGGKG